MRRVFRGARHHFVPPYMQDVLYKILVSGHAIGEHKRRGEDSECARCRTQHHREVESLEHAYATCERVANARIFV